MSEAPAPAASAELPAAELQRAWRLLRQPNWPESFDESMKEPLRARIVQMFARQLIRSDARTAAAGRLAMGSAPPVVARQVEHERRRPYATRAHGIVDRKRAAAGDRDD